MVLLQSSMVPLGSPAPNFDLMGIDGKQHSLATYADKKVLVVIFMCNHCPYVQKIWPDLVELEKRMPEEVQFVGINSNANPDYPEDSFEKMKEYMKKWDAKFIYLHDKGQEVAKAYWAVCTPDPFLLVNNGDFILAFHSRIDDKHGSVGSSEEMYRVVDELIETGNVTLKEMPSMGCSIKWKD